MDKKNDLHKKIMDSLIGRHQPIASLINKRNVVYAEIPVYNNIGDLFIMLGTIKFFERNSVNVKRILSVHDSLKKKITEENVIVLQGGGNLGDLYHLPQGFRERIIGDYPDNKIIILPQTIYFESKKNYQRCCEIFSRHNDLHIFVRDEFSYNLALKMSKNVYLAPDMAHQLYPINYLDRKRKKTLFINRNDKEFTPYKFNIEPENTTDWNALLKKHNLFIKLFNKFFQIASILKLGFILYYILPNLWIKYSNLLCNKATKLFAEYELIATNRLHGHILACLMDKRHIVYDNSYGKISSYVKLWTKDSAMVVLKEGAEQTEQDGATVNIEI